MTPIAFGYAIIEKNGDAKIFLNKKKLSKEVLVELKNDE
jgi:hypothetical protein